MNYKIIGESHKKTILFLHGWGGSIASFVGVANYFCVIGFRCVLVDFPGFGASSEPKTPYSVLDYANEVAKLLEFLKIDSCIVVGHSFGGRVSIVLAKTNPKLISKVVLVDSAGIKPKFSVVKSIRVAKYKRLKKKVMKGKFSVSKLDGFGSSDYKNLSTIMKQSFVKIVNEDLSNYANKIDKPCLIIWGNKDKETPLYMAKRLHKLIKNSRLIVYDGGHFSYLDNFENFIEDVFDFVV